MNQKTTKVKAVMLHGQNEHLPMFEGIVVVVGAVVGQLDEVDGVLGVAVGVPLRKDGESRMRMTTVTRFACDSKLRIRSFVVLPPTLRGVS